VECEQAAIESVDTARHGLLFCRFDPQVLPIGRELNELRGKFNQEVVMHKAPDENTTVYFTEQSGRLADAMNLCGVSE